MHRSLPLPFALSLLLAACSGGGGGGGGGVSVPLNGPVTPFTSFGAITNNSLVEFASPEIDDGLGGFEMTAVNVRATYDPALETVTSIDATTTEPVSALVYVDNAGEAAQARLTIGIPLDDDLVTDFTTAPVGGGDTDDFLVFANEVGGGVIADMLAFHAPDDDARALEFASFGMWALGLDTAEVNMGAATWGAQTPVLDMPGVGGAVYEGHLLGTWIDNAGNFSYYEADSELAANFLIGTVALSSINTRNLETGVGVGGLDIFNNGSATINGNTFTGGTFGIIADGLSVGEFNGAFYGPNVAEAGAAFDINFVNGRYFGAVGGKQVP
jgi:hypothetical protein